MGHRKGSRRCSLAPRAGKGCGTASSCDHADTEIWTNGRREKSESRTLETPAGIANGEKKSRPRGAIDYLPAYIWVHNCGARCRTCVRTRRSSSTRPQRCWQAPSCRVDRFGAERSSWANSRSRGRCCRNEESIDAAVEANLDSISVSILAICSLLRHDAV